ncbi:ParB family chromosome partitioning protein [Sphaerotilus hippei]|uniref:ParB family chromosome partitioning protein n=1 Tax=Sphaerotilus hippei TaxID=744406 RepID=A0A318GWD2_9BURK|nr:ParB/RepB/Spo0J family partition protein [Sphaerotilus hippei]PXW93991.1 ParB family chromosome partitioning protein [Sphaerotilus hippei]
MGLKDLKSKSDQALASIGSARPAEARPVRPTTAPGATAFMQPTIDALNQRAKAAEAIAQDYKAQLERQPVELALDLLIEVPHRRRRLTPEQFDELKGNLANNPLIHPVTVQRTAEGRFEILSGHNRAEAYRALGRATIPVVILELDEADVERSAFYANLLQPSLPDFEKYLGFRQERERSGHTQKRIAKDAGISESVVSMLFAFDQLPEAALQWIERRPDAIGMSCAAEMAKLCRAGRAEQVIEAIELLVEGQLSQKEAVRQAGRQASLPRTREAAASGPVRVRVGRLEFCQYQSRGTSLRIEFRSEEQRIEAEAAIAATLQALAEQARNASGR